MKTYSGGCHCGAVAYEVDLPDAIEVEDCNCSICRKSGYLHIIVPRRDFRLLSGEHELSTYHYNSGIAKHKFCRHCGIKSFYIPRSNPDGIDVNLNCLDAQPPQVTIEKFDGRNWEQNAGKLAHKSR